MGINFHSEVEGYFIKGKKDIRKWIQEIIVRNGKRCGEINIIFVDDKVLLDLNLKYLNHNYFTDIITFNYNIEDEISGDLYLSIDRIKDNAKNYKESLKREILRVIAHGLYHLDGIKDKTSGQKKVMREREDNALALFDSLQDK